MKVYNAAMPFLYGKGLELLLKLDINFKISPVLNFVDKILQILLSMLLSHPSGDLKIGSFEAKITHSIHEGIIEN